MRSKHYKPCYHAWIFGRRLGVLRHEDRVEQLTYAQLGEQARKTGLWTSEEGVEPGTHMQLWAEPSAHWMVVCSQYCSVGAVVVPLDVQLSDEALRHAYGIVGLALRSSQRAFAQALATTREKIQMRAHTAR